ncbi:MAG: hypothetical protein WEE89_14500 [Gemmatimonadota bacterium]
MPIGDLLYACVECRTEGSLRRAKRGEVCDRCGTRYTRADGALIRCERPGQEPEVKHPAEWLDHLHEQPLHHPATTAAVTLRCASEYKPYTHAGVLLGFIEELGPPEEGTLELGPESIVFRSATGERRWPLDALTAVQPTTGTLNLKVRNGPLIALRFRTGSPLLWEERVKNAIQERFAAAGRGDIAEYLPRIVCG